MKDIKIPGDVYYVMCNYFALTSLALLSQIWERREVEAVLAPFSQAWEQGWG
jgi:hypothetical protein